MNDIGDTANKPPAPTRWTSPPVVPRYKGVGGWWLLFCLGLIVLSPLLTLGSFASLVGVNGQEVAEQTRQYEVVMYEGIPPESMPKKVRKKLPPEKPVLIAPVDADGKFHANLNGAMFEGSLKSVEGGKVEIEIKQSQLNSTDGFPINAIVKLNQAMSPGGYGFNSILFAYYFRVRSRTDGKQESPGNAN